MLTPLRSPITPAEKSYQFHHIRTRNLIERTFGAWKSKFQCLKGLRLKLSTSMNVITACAVIWNFLLLAKEVPDEPFEADEYTFVANDLPAETSSSRNKDLERKRLIDGYFTRLAREYYAGRQTQTSVPTSE